MLVAGALQSVMVCRAEVSQKTRDDGRCQPIDSPPFHTLRTVDSSLVSKGFEQLKQLEQLKGNAS